MSTIFWIFAIILLIFWIIGLVRRTVSWIIHLLLLLAAGAIIIGVLLHG